MKCSLRGVMIYYCEWIFCLNSDPLKSEKSTFSLNIQSLSPSVCVLFAGLTDHMHTWTWNRPAEQCIFVLKTRLEQILKSQTADHMHHRSSMEAFYFLSSYLFVKDCMGFSNKSVSPNCKTGWSTHLSINVVVSRKCVNFHLSEISL